MENIILVQYCIIVVKPRSSAFAETLRDRYLQYLAPAGLLLIIGCLRLFI